MVLGCFGLRVWARFGSSITRSGRGWPTRSRALALTALTTENFSGRRFRFAIDILPGYGNPVQVWNTFYAVTNLRESGAQAMEERDFFEEKTEQRKHTLTCPHCGK